MYYVQHKYRKIDKKDSQMIAESFVVAAQWVVKKQVFRSSGPRGIRRDFLGNWASVVLAAGLLQFVTM